MTGLIIAVLIFCYFAIGAFIAGMEDNKNPLGWIAVLWPIAVVYATLMLFFDLTYKLGQKTTMLIRKIKRNRRKKGGIVKNVRTNE